MLNKKKIRLMTRSAIYEKHEGKEDLKICQYSKSDYVRFSMLKTLIGVTVSILLCAVIYAVCSAEELFELIFTEDLTSLIEVVLVIYLLFLGIYVIVSLLYYPRKYKKAKKRVNEYNKKLTLIEEMDEEPPVMKSSRRGKQK